MGVKKILVIDDENMIRLSLQAHLEDEGYEVVCAVTGEEGLEKLQADPGIDLAIVDLRLPGIDGEEVIQRAFKMAPHVKYIMHTGSNEFVMSEKLRSAGMSNDQILYKPILDINVLSNLINRMKDSGN